MPRNIFEVPESKIQQNTEKPKSADQDLSKMNSQQLADFYRRQQFEKRMDEGKDDLRRRIKTETVVGPDGTLGIRKIEDRNKEILAKKRLEIDNITDAEGRGIDEEIKDVIVAFNVAEIPTVASCQGGHYGEEAGLGAPWVEIGSLDEPEERFNNQNEIFQRIAKKYGLSFYELKHSHNPNAYWEAMKEASQQGETVEYQTWDMKNQELFTKVKNLLDEFYKDRKINDNLKLQLDEYVGRLRIYSGGDDYKEIDQNISPEEQESHKIRLELYRKEMKRFAEFLISKFLK